MDEKLSALEAKISQLVTVCQNLQLENAALLRALNVQMELVNILKTNMLLARERLSALIDNLP